MIVFTRHAKTYFNDNKILHGTLDVSLSESGMKEAIEASKNISQKFDVCFCSPMKRAQETAKILVPYLTPIIDIRLTERDLGDWKGIEATEEVIKYLKTHDSAPNGETTEHMDKRTLEFINMLKQDYKDKNIIVITHSGVVHSVCRIFSKEIDTAKHLDFITIEFD